MTPFPTEWSCAHQPTSPMPAEGPGTGPTWYQLSIHPVGDDPTMTELLAAMRRAAGVRRVIADDYVHLEVDVAAVNVGGIEAEARAVGFDIFWS